MNLRKSALQISIINATGTILGFIVHILLGREFGVSWELDCLFISLLIFSFFGIFNILITSLLIPIFNEIKAKDEKDSFVFADVTFKWSLSIGIIIWLFILTTSPLIIKLFASGFDEKAISLTSEILKILFIGYIFYNLTSSISTILNALYFFFMPVFISLLGPIFNITAIIFLTPKYGVKSIAISYLFSNILQIFILIPYLFVKTNWRPTLKIYHNKLPELFRHSSKTLASSLIWSIWDIISRNIASHLGSGMIVLLSYAEKIISILHQTIISPTSSVFYSKVSELIALVKWNEVRNLMMKILQVNISISIMVSAGIIVFLKPLLTILFLNSKFTLNDINTLSYLMIIEIIYLLSLSLELPLIKVIYSAKMTNIALLVPSIGVILFYILSNILSNLLGIYGLVLSMSISRIPIFILYFYFLSRYINTTFGKTFRPLIKNSIFAAVFISIGLFINWNIKKDIFILMFWVPIWTVIYFLTFRYILKEEWGILINREV